MNHDSPHNSESDDVEPRGEQPGELDANLEARIVALVLNEVSDFERDELLRMIGERADVRAFYQQIQHIHGTLQEAATAEMPPADADWKLPDEKRNAVLAVLKGEQVTAAKDGADETVAGSAEKTRKWKWNAGQVAVALLVAGFVGVITLPMTLQSEKAEYAATVTAEGPKDRALVAGTEMSGFERSRGRFVSPMFANGSVQFEAQQDGTERATPLIPGAPNITHIAGPLFKKDVTPEPSSSLSALEESLALPAGLQRGSAPATGLNWDDSTFALNEAVGADFGMLEDRRLIEAGSEPSSGVSRNSNTSNPSSALTDLSDAIGLPQDVDGNPGQASADLYREMAPFLGEEETLALPFQSGDLDTLSAFVDRVMDEQALALATENDRPTMGRVSGRKSRVGQLSEGLGDEDASQEHWRFNFQPSKDDDSNVYFGIDGKAASPKPVVMDSGTPEADYIIFPLAMPSAEEESIVDEQGSDSKSADEFERLLEGRFGDTETESLNLNLGEPLIAGGSATRSAPRAFMERMADPISPPDTGRLMFGAGVHSDDGLENSPEFEIQRITPATEPDNAASQSTPDVFFGRGLAEKQGKEHWRFAAPAEQQSPSGVAGDTNGDEPRVGVDFDFNVQDVIIDSVEPRFDAPALIADTDGEQPGTAGIRRNFAGRGQTPMSQSGGVQWGATASEDLIREQEQLGDVSAGTNRNLSRAAGEVEEQVELEGLIQRRSQGVQQNIAAIEPPTAEANAELGLGVGSFGGGNGGGFGGGGFGGGGGGFGRGGLVGGMTAPVGEVGPGNFNNGVVAPGEDINGNGILDADVVGGEGGSNNALDTENGEGINFDSFNRSQATLIVGGGDTGNVIENNRDDGIAITATNANPLVLPTEVIVTPNSNFNVDPLSVANIDLSGPLATIEKSSLGGDSGSGSGSGAGPGAGSGSGSGLGGSGTGGSGSGFGGSGSGSGSGSVSGAGRGRATTRQPADVILGKGLEQLQRKFESAVVVDEATSPPQSGPQPTQQPSAVTRGLVAPQEVEAEPASPGGARPLTPGPSPVRASGTKGARATAGTEVELRQYNSSQNGHDGAEFITRGDAQLIAGGILMETQEYSEFGDTTGAPTPPGRRVIVDETTATGNGLDGVRIPSQIAEERKQLGETLKQNNVFYSLNGVEKSAEDLDSIQLGPFYPWGGPAPSGLSSEADKSGSNRLSTLNEIELSVTPPSDYGFPDTTTWSDLSRPQSNDGKDRVTLEKARKESVASGKEVDAKKRKLGRSAPKLNLLADTEDDLAASSLYDKVPSRIQRAMERNRALREKHKAELEQLKLGVVSPALKEISAQVTPFSTFSLNVSDVSFKLALSALSQGKWPEASKIRIEDFVNAFDYGDPLPGRNEAVACTVEQAVHPLLQQRNLMRISMKTAAAGRASSTPLDLTLLLDNSGSMERIDRQQTVQRAFAALAAQLKPTDKVTLISFAGTPRLLADDLSGDKAKSLVQTVVNLPSEGGTNIEAALQLAIEKAEENRASQAESRIVLLTDGAVNLGDADPESLSGMVTEMRNSGIAFDAAGISADGLNDKVLEALTRQGDGRYYLLDSEESVHDGFAQQLAGALRPSAKNVKVQIEFNPKRVGQYKLLGFEKHRLKKEDFRNDKVDAAEMAAAEAGVAVYQFEAKPDGEGDVGSVSVRFRDLSSGEMVEHRWPIPYEPQAARLSESESSMRVASAAAFFAAKLKGDPLGEAVDLKALAEIVNNLPSDVREQTRVAQLGMMIDLARQMGR